MRRFEKMAEENRCCKDEQEIEFIIEKPEGITVTSEVKSKKRVTKTS